MSSIWTQLIDLQRFFTYCLDDISSRFEEPEMHRFNRDGWVNLTWKNVDFRRAHLDVVDARDTKGLWMMHCCIFPRFTNSAPIFGFDVIAGKNKITGCFIDYSPTLSKSHELIRVFETISSENKWKKTRNLPLWAQQIFSENMVAIGNAKEDEIFAITNFAKELFTYYIQNLKYFAFDSSFDAISQMVVDSHEKYGYYQRQNPHTPKTMKALGLDEQDVEFFVSKCLFPSVKG